MRVGYAAGYRDGIAAARAEWERLLAVLREELATKERERADAITRADLACDRLLQFQGARAVSTIGRQVERDQAAAAAEAVRASAYDPFAELPPGDPNGDFGAPDLGPDLLGGIAHGPTAA